jgi:hypothetical protein
MLQDYGACNDHRLADQARGTRRRSRLVIQALSMILRLIPLLETTATGATQLPQRFSWLISARNANKLYSSKVPWSIHLDERLRVKERQEYKRKDYGPSEHSRKGKTNFLTPYDLSRRIEALCVKGDLREAISSVKEAPLDAQNAVVWATLIRSVIANGKYQEAYRLFIDVSYLTMLHVVAELCWLYR